MEKRAILAIVLSMLVLIFYQRLFVKKQPQRREERKEIERIEPKPSAPGVSERRAGREVYEGVAGRGEERFVAKKVGEEERKTVRDVTVETSLYSATFSSHGGRLKSWRLHHYKNHVENGRFVGWFQETENKVRKLLPFLGQTPIPEGKPEPVELVATEALANLPLAIEVADEGGKVAVGPMDVDSDSVFLGGSVKEGTLLFRASPAENLELSRKYRFSDDKYRLDMEVRIKNRNERPREVRMALVWFGKMLETGSRAFSGPVAMVDGQVVEIKEKKFRKSSYCCQATFNGLGAQWVKRTRRINLTENLFSSPLSCPRKVRGLNSE